MSIVLSILSVIGIILLCILGLIIFVLMLVLFAPIRYKAKFGADKEKFTFFADASWLFHALDFSYCYGDDSIGGLRIFGFLNKGKEEPEEENNKASELNWDDDNDKASLGTSVSDMPETDGNTVKEANEKAETSSTQKENTNNKDSFYDKIKKYIEIVRTDTFSRAYSITKHQIFKLLKRILPSSLKLRGEIGFDDPSVNGVIIAFISLLYPFPFFDIDVTADFENEVFHLEGSVKGRIYIYKIIVVFFILFFNKDVRRIIKMFREV